MSAFDDNLGFNQNSLASSWGNSVAVQPGMSGGGAGRPAAQCVSPISGRSMPCNSPDFQKAVKFKQDEANKANEDRYAEGKGVITQGNTAAQGAISQALASSQGIGTQATNRINTAEQAGLAGNQQSAINRGLGNTTIVDSLNRGTQRNAEDARQGVDEQVANRQIGINQQQAALSMQGASSLSNFIAARNDVGPDPALYANLAQQAAATPAPSPGLSMSSGGSSYAVPSIKTPTQPQQQGGYYTGAGLQPGMGGAGSISSAVNPTDLNGIVAMLRSQGLIK